MFRRILLISILILIFGSIRSIAPTLAQDDMVGCQEDALQEALQAGGEITLSANCIYQLSRNLPSITTDISIHGNGAIIDGDGQYRLLSTVGRVDVSLENLTLRNGAYGSGAALYALNGNVLVERVIFENNIALFGQGGAIWIQSGTLDISHSTFSDNHAQASSDTIDSYQARGVSAGGAIWVEQGTISLRHNTFDMNGAQVGGAVYLETGQITVEGSRFINNEGVLSGGALQLGIPIPPNQQYPPQNTSSTSQIRVVNSIFAHNHLDETIESLGGGIFSSEGTITITASTIVSNQASIGGGIYSYNGTIEIGQSIVALNSPDEIPVEQTLVSQGYNLFGNDGNGRLVVSETDILNVDPQFTDLDAGSFELDPSSPAVNAIPATECATDTDQLGQERPQGGWCEIGAIEIVGIEGADDMVQSETDNTEPAPITCNENDLRDALVQGGRIELGADCHLTLTQDLPDISENIVLFGNNAVLDGDGAFQLFNAPTFADITIQNITLQNSPYPNIVANRGNIVVEVATLQNGGTMAENGGAIYAGSGSIQVEDTLIQGFEASNGGAIYAYNGSVDISNSQFWDNQADGFGGVIWTAQGDITIADSEFNGNIANNGSGGAIFTETGTVTVENVVFTANTAQRIERGAITPIGGAIATENGVVNSTASGFYANASMRGGAIAALNGSISLIDSTLEGNRAGEGGAVNSGNSTVTIENSRFTQNTAANQGGVISDDHSTQPTTISNSVFANNQANGQGGALYGSSPLVVTNSIFVSNTAGDSGGAMYFWGTADITHCTLVFNVADYEGGGFFSWGDITLSHSIVADNTASASPELGLHFMAEFTSLGYNLFGYSFGLTLHRTDITSEEIGVLDFDGELVLLGADSPALNAIPADLCELETDLRSVSRPQGDGCDIGAVEMRESSDGALLDVPLDVPNAADSETDELVEVECNEAALRDAIREHSHLSLAADCTYELQADLPILSRDLTIIGNSAIIDGLGQHRLFYSAANLNLSIDHLTIANGYSISDGGGINLINGVIHLDHVQFMDNQAENNGGAVMAGTETTINYSVFVGNRASFGGAIFSRYATVTIRNSTISQNYAADGGAVYATLGSQIQMESVTIAQNEAESTGGGLYLQFGAILIQHSIVVDNEAAQSPNVYLDFRASLESGGYNIIGETVDTRMDRTDQFVSDAGLDEFTGTLFPLTEDSPAVDAIPSDLCGESDQVDVERPQGEGCDIGAVEMVQDEHFHPTRTDEEEPVVETIPIDCTEIALHDALNDGGSFELPENCTIRLMTSLPTIGSDLHLSGKNVVIDSVGSFPILRGLGSASISIDGLTLQNGINDNGGAISTELGDISVNNSTFINNQAEQGGAIYSDEGIVVISGSVFTNNRVQGDLNVGGAIAVSSGDLEVYASTFEGNDSGDGGNGGAIMVWYGTLLVEGSTFTGNHAGFRGGAICQLGSGNSDISTSTFSGNIALGQQEASGGAVYIEGGSLAVNASVFYDNRSTYGGAITNYWGDMLVTNSTFAHNSVHVTGDQYDYGVGGALDGDYGNLTVINSTIVGNEASGAGGGINMSFGGVHIQQSVVAGNSAPQGADVFIYDGSFYSEGYNLFTSLGSPFPLDDTDQLVVLELGDFDESQGVFPLNEVMLDVVPSEDCASQTDQRGLARPSGDGCDIGAVELQPNEMETLLTASTAPSTEPISFVEDFSDNELDWETAQNADNFPEYYDDMFSDFEDGAYVIRTENAGWGWYVGPGFHDWDKAPIFNQPIELSVTIRVADASSNQIGASVYFNVQQGYSSYIGFSIYPDGTYYIFTNTANIQSGVAESGIDLLDHEAHTITIRASNEEYTFLVDDQEIGSTSSFGVIDGSVALGISLILSSGRHSIEVYFDDLTVRSLEE